MISYQIDDRQLRRAFNKAPKVTSNAIRSWVKRSALKTERAAKDDLRKNVSRGSSGDTLNSIKTKFDTDRQGAVVRPTVEHAYYAHEGRAPGKMPPWGKRTSLAAWARRMDIEPFAVAVAIGRRGTEGHPFMDNAYKDVKYEVENDARKILTDIIRKI